MVCVPERRGGGRGREGWREGERERESRRRRSRRVQAKRWKCGERERMADVILGWVDLLCKAI